MIAQKAPTQPVSRPQAYQQSWRTAPQVFSHREHRYWFDQDANGWRVWRADEDRVMETVFCSTGELRQRLDASLIADAVIYLQRSGEQVPQGERLVLPSYAEACSLRNTLWVLYGLAETLLIDCGPDKPAGIVVDLSPLPASERAAMRQMAWAGYVCAAADVREAA